MAAVLAAVVAVVVAAAIPPAPARWVTDPTGALTPAARATLDRRLEAYERATGHQVVVWIGDSLGGEPVDDWAVRTFAAWKIGRKGFDDGVAMFLFMQDRVIDIEVGYGLEDRVPDAVAARIIREVMTPRLRAGDVDGAVTAGTDALLAAIEGRPWAGGREVGARPPGGGVPAGGEWTLGKLIVLGLGALGLLILLVTHPRLALLLLWTTASGGRGGGGGFGGGGGGGGFRGGGGRSGGGGARGSW